MIKKIIKKIAFDKGKLKGLYIRLCKPSGLEYANFLKKWGGYYQIGEDCSIPTYAHISNPYLTKIGNNVRLSNCTILGHDGSVNMLNRAYNKKLDKVGPVDIGNNVFVGHGAIILPNTKIGDNCIIAAGAVVRGEIPNNSVAGGVPAKVICSTESYLQKTESESNNYPWIDLVRNRKGDYDPTLEITLKKLRSSFFFPAK